MEESPSESNVFIIVGEKRIPVPDGGKLHLLYILEEHGWATFAVAQNGKYCSSSVSYIYDSLYVLLETACSLMQGSRQEMVEFHCEPGVYRLFLETKDEGFLSLKMRGYYDGSTPLEKFHEAFKGLCKLKRYVQQLLACCDKILQEDGAEGYLKKWQLSEFPMDKYLKLKSLWDQSFTH
jgi:hypothetical protein